MKKRYYALILTIILISVVLIPVVIAEAKTFEDIYEWMTLFFCDLTGCEMTGNITFSTGSGISCTQLFNGSDTDYCVDLSDTLWDNINNILYSKEKNVSIGSSTDNTILEIVYNGSHTLFVFNVSYPNVMFNYSANTTFGRDVTILGTLYGGSPVKISGINISNNLFFHMENANRSLNFVLQNTNGSINASTVISTRNDVGGSMSIGIGSSDFMIGSVSYKNVTALFSRSKGKTVFANFFNESFTWMYNPSDDNDAENLVEIMKLNEFGLNLSSGIISNKTVNTPSPTFSLSASDSIPSTHTMTMIQGSGGAVDLTSNPQIAAGVDGQFMTIMGMSDTNTITLETGDGLHLHSGKMIIGAKDHVLFHYDAMTNEWHELTNNFATSEKSFAFDSPSGSSGTFYFGGFYRFASSDNDFSPSTTFGTENSAYAAHFFVVLGAQAVDDINITVTGTSITDSGTRTASDSENITMPSGSVVNSYNETTKKWIGQVTVETTTGTAKTANYGFAKYWDNNNNDFRVLGLEATWLGGASDTAPDIKLRHHQSSGWTFNSGSTPTPPTEVASMATDYSTEDNVKNNEEGAWKRDNLNEGIEGTGSEGIIIEIVTTANKAFEQGNFLLRIRPD